MSKQNDEPYFGRVGSAVGIALSGSLCVFLVTSYLQAPAKISENANLIAQRAADAAGRTAETVTELQREVRELRSAVAADSASDNLRFERVEGTTVEFREYMAGGPRYSAHDAEADRKVIDGQLGTAAELSAEKFRQAERERNRLERRIDRLEGVRIESGP